jgi:hypothetical protein
MGLHGVEPNNRLFSELLLFFGREGNASSTAGDCSGILSIKYYTGEIYC